MKKITKILPVLIIAMMIAVGATGISSISSNAKNQEENSKIIFYHNNENSINVQADNSAIQNAFSEDGGSTISILIKSDWDFDSKREDYFADNNITGINDK